MKSSSHLEIAEEESKYLPINAFDNNLETVWSGSAPNYGIGDWIQSKFDQVLVLAGVGIVTNTEVVAGSKEGWNLVPRPRLFLLELSNERKFQLYLEDRPGVQAYLLNLPQRLEKGWIRLTIIDVYPPTSGLEVFYNPPIAEIYLRGKTLK